MLNPAVLAQALKRLPSGEETIDLDLLSGNSSRPRNAKAEAKGGLERVSNRSSRTQRAKGSLLPPCSFFPVLFLFSKPARRKPKLQLRPAQGRPRRRGGRKGEAKGGAEAAPRLSPSGLASAVRSAPEVDAAGRLPQESQAGLVSSL